MKISGKSVSKRAAAQYLRAAAKFLEAHKLTKGQFSNGHGAYCGIGAMKAVDEDAHYSDVGLVARKAFSLVNGYFGIPSFNDRPETTKADVVKAFRKTAAALDHGLKVKI